MLAALLLLLAAGQAQAAAEPSLQAVRLTGEEIELDGRLDEPAWRRAPMATGFRQREPREGEPASEQTEVRVLYDERHLYVGVRARDAEPGQLIGRILQRDKLMEAAGFDGAHDFAGDDAVAILLDPFRDRRNAFVFATNPNGAEFEALVTDERAALNVDWRTVWSVGAARGAEGWSAEFAIPFRSLRYPAGRAGAWGFNVYRVIRRRNEKTLWSAWTRDDGGFHRVSRAGRLEGLDELPRAGLNLEVKPFALAGALREGAAASTDGRLDVGLDGKWEVRPGLVLDATLNPDFAQVEADDEQVNLTRFDLFFPEKRDFFLENAGVFDFGWRGIGEPPPFLMFFSRRIGIAEDLGEVPVYGGLRLTGRAGRQTVGLLDAFTGPAFGQPATNFGVLRVKRDIGHSHYLGAMVADARRRGRANTAAGLDWSFWPTGSTNVQGFVAGTRTTGSGGDDVAYRLAVDYSGDRQGLFASHLVVGPEAQADMGFITRTDMRRSDVFGRLTVRPPAAGLRKVDLVAGVFHVTGLDGEKQDLLVGPFAIAEWNTGDSLSLFYVQGSTRLDEGFDLSDRVPVAPGDYPTKTWGWFAATSGSRPVVLRSQALVQETYGGRVWAAGGSLSVAPDAHLAVTVGLTRNRADLPGGSFTADLATLRLAWSFSTRLAAHALLQYNGLDRKLLANVRLGFVHRPGSDLFVVFNEERGSESVWRPVTSRGFAVKLTWLARF